MVPELAAVCSEFVISAMTPSHTQTCTSSFPCAGEEWGRMVELVWCDSPTLPFVPLLPHVLLCTSRTEEFLNSVHFLTSTHCYIQLFYGGFYCVIFTNTLVNSPIYQCGGNSHFTWKPSSHAMKRRVDKLVLLVSGVYFLVLLHKQLHNRDLLPRHTSTNFLVHCP